MRFAIFSGGFTQGLGLFFAPALETLSYLGFVSNSGRVIELLSEQFIRKVLLPNPVTIE